MDYKSNINKLYIIKASKWFMLFMPVLYLFYEDNGLSARHLFILKAIYSLSVVVLEIPSGYFADKLGRKFTLIVGAVMGFCGMLAYSISYDFTGFMIAEILLGVGGSFISGSDSAILYDTLKQSNKSEKYSLFEGRMTSLGNFGEAIAGVIGGFIAVYSFRLPFVFQTGIAFIAIPAAIMIKEPTLASISAKSKNIIRQSIKALKDSKELVYHILLSSIIGCATLTMAWFVQPYLKVIDIPVALFGITWTALNLLVGVSSLFAYRVEQKIGIQKSLVLIVIGIMSIYLALFIKPSYAGIGLIVVFYLIRGFATPVLKDYINRLTPSDVRATILSLRNFTIRLLFAAIAPFAGWLTEQYAINIAIPIIGTVFLLVSVIVSLLIIRSSK